MAAKRLWVGLFLEFGAYALLAGALHRYTAFSTFGAAVLPLVLAFAVRVGLVIATFAFATFAQPRPPALPLPAWALMLAREVAALLRFEALILADSLRRDSVRSSTHAQPIARADAPLVILLHGIYCSRAVWQPLLRELRGRTGCEVRAPSLTPAIVDLAAQARCFARWLDDSAGHRSERRVIVVAHSLGGLVARLYLARRMGATRIYKLICLATPHRGSVLARALRSPIARDLCPGSAILAEIEASGADTMVDIVCLRTRHDNLVVPADSARLPGARDIVLDGVGHISLIYSREVMELLVREIGSVAPMS